MDDGWVQEQLRNQLYEVFELMRERNFSEGEQRAVGGIRLNPLHDQLHLLLASGNNSAFGIIGLGSYICTHRIRYLYPPVTLPAHMTIPCENIHPT